MSSTGKSLLVLVLGRTLLNAIAVTISSFQQPLITLTKREIELRVNPREMATEHWFARPVNKALCSLGSSEKSACSAHHAQMSDLYQVHIHHVLYRPSLSTTQTLFSKNRTFGSQLQVSWILFTPHPPYPSSIPNPFCLLLA